MSIRTGQILIAKGRITIDQLREGLRTQAFFGGKLGGHLIHLGFIEEEDLGQVLSEIHGVGAVGREQLRAVPWDVAARVPAALAVKFSAVPFGIDGSRLDLALVNPRNAVAIRELSRASGLTIQPFVAAQFRIIQAIEKLYRVKIARKRRIVVRPDFPSIGRRVPRGRRSSSSTRVPSVGEDPAPIQGPVREDTPVPVFPSPDAGKDLPSSLQEWREPDDEEAPGDNPQGELPSEPHAPIGFEEAAAQVGRARSSRDIFHCVVGFMAGSFRRVAALALFPNGAKFIGAAGAEVDGERLRGFVLPIGQASFLDVLDEGAPFHQGPVSVDSEVSRSFFDCLGGAVPAEAFIVPVRVGDRLVTILYADNAPAGIGAVDPVLWMRLHDLVTIGMEIRNLKRKLLSL